MKTILRAEVTFWIQVLLFLSIHTQKSHWPVLKKWSLYNTFNQLTMDRYIILSTNLYKILKEFFYQEFPESSKMITWFILLFPTLCWTVKIYLSFIYLDCRLFCYIAFTWCTMVTEVGNVFLTQIAFTILLMFQQHYTLT